VGEAAGREDHGLAGAHADGRAARRGGLDADDRAVGGDQALYAVSGADVDPVARSRLAHRAHTDLAAVAHRLAGVLGHQDAAGRRLVLRQLRPVVGHVATVPVGQGAALAQQLGGGGGALVDRAAQRELPLAQAQRGAVGVVVMRAREARDVAQEVRFAVRDPEVAHRGVVRHPVPERSLAGGAAELRRLLEEHDLVPQPTGEQGRGQPPAPTADDDDVGLDVERRIGGGGRRRGARRDGALAHAR
jgi:hypothetical protein